MNWASIFLLTFLLTLLNILIASRFREVHLAKNRLKASMLILTIMTCLVFALSVSRQASTAYILPISLITYSVLLIDWVAKRIPNRITLYLAILQTLSILTSAILEKSLAPINAIYLGLGTFVLFLLLNLISKGQLGMGDVKLSYSLAVGIGSISPYLIYWTFLLAFSMAGIFALGLLLSQRASLQSSFAFGPFMVMGAWLSLLMGIFIPLSS